MALLPEVADEPTVFDCVVFPSEPGLQTRTGEAVLPDELPPHPQSDLPCPKICTAPERATDPWSVAAFWPATWIALPPQPQPWPAAD